MLLLYVDDRMGKGRWGEGERGRWGDGEEGEEGEEGRQGDKEKLAFPTTNYQLPTTNYQLPIVTQDFWR
ncbi:MAG: hypothetical protein WBA07_21120 [Rivularia sp. (in: cyanobacteria)]